MILIYKQRGAVLIVALLLITVIGILGISVMNTSVDEYEISVAQEVESTTFSVIESAVMQAYSDLDATTLPVGQDHEVAVSTTDSRIDVTVTARRDGIVPVVNTSLALFGIYAYSIRGVGTNTAVNSQRTVVKGVAQQVPLVR